MGRISLFLIQGDRGRKSEIEGQQENHWVEGPATIHRSLNSRRGEGNWTVKEAEIRRYESPDTDEGKGGKWVDEKA